MKSIHKIGLAFLATALVLPFAAQAEGARVSGPYVGLSGLSTFQTNADSKTSAVTNKIEYDAGWGVLVNGGYGWDNGLRAEGEFGYRRSSVDKVTGPSSGVAGGHINNLSLMANGYYDVKTGTMFTPYVGAGVGVAAVDADDIRTVDGQTLDKMRYRFAYQGIAGVSTAVAEHWSVTADYRYFETVDPRFKTTNNDSAKTENASHNIMVGVRYSFGAPEAPKPLPQPAKVAPVIAPAPAPVAAPAVPAVPQSYMVFFDFDRATLTPEAKRIIASAAQGFKQGQYVRIVVTGHTDTMGSVKYNKKLSMKRAKAVEVELAKEGVPASVVEMIGAGKSQLLVPTAEGVREAQNRRAEIVMSK